MIPVGLPLSPLAREGSLALVSRAQKDAELALLTYGGDTGGQFNSFVEISTDFSTEFLSGIAAIT